MKLFRSILLLAVIVLLGSGCISRTTTIDHQHRGDIPKGKKYGSKSSDELVEKKTIWFWQDDFRKPK